MPCQIGVDLLAERIERGPGFFGKRRRHARPFADALHAHVVGEGDLARFDHAADRRRRAIMRRRGQRDVTLAAEQPRCRIESDPARARQIDLGPGMQIGKIEFRACRAIERFHVRPQLNEIAGDEARRQADLAQDLHQEPGRVAAGAGAGGERFLGRLHARLHADQIADQVLQALIELDQKIDGVARLARDRPNKFQKQRAGRFRLDEGREILMQHLRREFERPLLGIGLDEKVERIDDLHVGEEIDGDGEFAGLLRKDVARQPIAVRVLLPVHEMLRRRHRKRVARNPRAAVRRRPQPHGLRAETDRPIVGVTGGVVEPDEDRHAATRYARICPVICSVSMQFPGRRNRLCRSGATAAERLCPSPERLATP